MQNMKTAPLRDILAANLRHLMDAHPTLNTQMRVAAKCGLGQRTIGRILNAEVEPQLGHVQAIAEALAVSVPDLLTDWNSPPAQLIYDRQQFAQLPPEDRAKIQAFIDFVVTSHSASLSADVSTLNASQTLTPTPAQREMLKRVAQRPLSNKTLSINETHARKPAEKRKGR